MTRGDASDEDVSQLDRGVVVSANLDALDPSRTALVVVDMNNWNSHPDFGLGRLVRDNNVPEEGYWERVENLVVPNVRRLLDAFRQSGARVVFTEAGSYFADYGDANPNTRAMWEACNARDGELDSRTRPELEPFPGEPVLVKNCSSAWVSTPIDYLLRQAGVDTVVFAGVVANGCVMLSAFAAFDYGYRVHVVRDAVASLTEHEFALAFEMFAQFGFGLWTTAEVQEALA